MRFRGLILAAAVTILVQGLLFAQTDLGQLHLQVFDQSGNPIAASVQVRSEANQVERSGKTTPAGVFIARDLPPGSYLISVSREGFANSGQLVTVRPAVPAYVTAILRIAPLVSQVEVKSGQTLIDQQQVGTTYSIGSRQLQDTLPSQPGRQISDAAVDQPGWLYEANGVLHPREAEYGVQYVVDGIPLTENRSPGFAPPFLAGNVDSVRARTATYAPEFGRKLGAVIELNGRTDSAEGLHGQLQLGGGTYGNAEGFLGLSYKAADNFFNLSAQGARTDRFLDPPVLENFTNTGSFDGFAGEYARDFQSGGRLRFGFSRATSSFQVPNELVQQEAGQIQDRGAGETSGRIFYQQSIRPNLVVELTGSIRDVAADLSSNAYATPIIVDQQRGFREYYIKGDLAGHVAKNDWKVGVDGLFSNVNERLNYLITNPADFDPGTAVQFAFSGLGYDREQAVFAQDELHLGTWNLAGGVRFDHYDFLVDETACSPRFGISKYFSRSGILVHASYDRVFETPAIENLLLASSPEVAAIGDSILRLAVPPAHANFYEIGATKALAGTISMDVNLYKRQFKDFADDDVLLDTGVTFPIAFAHATVEGLEAKLQFREFHHLSGFLSYTNQSGTAQGPVTGGLLLGDEAASPITSADYFAISQDQRNTAAARLNYQVTKRIWAGAGARYGSGLPTELDSGDLNFQSLLAQYGPQVVGKVNFDLGRVRPSFTLDFAGGWEFYRKENKALSLQAQVSNVLDRVNLINFAGLFSGTAIAPGRNFSVQIRSAF